MRLLTTLEVERLLTPALALRAVRRAFQAVASKQWRPGESTELNAERAPIRIAWSRDEESGLAADMAWDRAGSGRILFQEPPEYRALLKLEAIHRLRASAVSSLATESLARADASVLAVIGTGDQARLHIHAITRVRDIKRVLVVGRTAAKAQLFVAELLRELGGGMRFEATDAGRASSLADVLCLCTDSATPVLLGNEVGKGCHINAIGATTFDAREVDTNTVLRSKVVIEDKEYGITSAGDLRIPVEEGRIDGAAFQTDLGDLVAGKRTARACDDDITFFKSVGHPAVDFYLALAAYEAAVEERVGVEVEL
ncbi:MAG: ornithine cyclodeaminase family protein [Elusimicrobia bacterium]|nr:ornithine cyclodeaminase family protein [Elusimicrobiota bacterium]